MSVTIAFAKCSKTFVKKSLQNIISYNPYSLEAMIG
jgi:hypothetical protein